MTKTKKKPDYEIGYKKPPRDTRFRPGQSGNPRGRPRRSRNFANMLEEALHQKVRITKGSDTSRVSAYEAMAYKLVEDALKGGPREVAKLLSFVDQFVPSMTEPESTLPGEILINYVKSDGNGRPLNLTDEEIEWVLARRKRLFVESSASDASEAFDDEPDFLK